MYQTILVPLDGSPLGERALPYAVALGERSGARLLLVEVAIASVVTRNDPRTGEPHAIDLVEEYLAAVAGRIAGRVTVETLKTRGEPGNEIVRLAERRRADLIAMSTHGRSGIGRWLYGSVAEHVLLHARVPVLLVPSTSEHPWPDPDGGQAPRILVALDGSTAAFGAVGAAGDLAQALGASVLLLRVLAGGDVAAADLDAARAYLEETAGPLRHRGHRVEAAVAQGPPAATIAAFARDRGADVVALATRGRGALGLPVLGSVASEMVHRAQVPLLLVRAATAEAAR
jgi:nucleotide-binding universal stress UspA family protein